MEKSQIIRTEYAEIMKKSYIDYAMSVIVSRALPDVRDGLKPVQRRTLYDMHELGIWPDRPYRKCARIVGDTMGKYHPHGDSSIYEALVVMAQDFKKGQILVDGHGNFGSIEGDGAAAMRYTEARLSAYTKDTYLEDLDKNIVDFVPNFDENEKEPEVLPSRVPNLLINGAEGIAVGMATSIPPHNLGEVIEGVKAYLDNPQITTKELMMHIKGPDFPTGGIVVNKDELLSVYETGAGRIRLRGKIQVENGKGGKKRLVITQIPYTMVGAGIGKFLNDVAGLIENKTTTEITDISNQSSKEGIRIVLELKKDADIENLKNMLYKKTRLEDTFGVNMLAVAQGRPEILSLRQVIEHHVDFQFEVTTRKYRTLLQQAEEQREIKEGLIRACDVIDLIIEILRGSTSIQDAKACLTKGDVSRIKFKSQASKQMAALLDFTERQAKAILEMRLYKLIGLEVEALQADYQETLKRIRLYQDILNNYDTMAQVIVKELDAIKEKYNKDRMTAIENGKEAVFEENKVEEQTVVFLMDRFGYARTIDESTFERNKEAALEENRYVISLKNTDRLCCFTEDGKIHQVKVLDVPFGKFRDKGQPIDNMSNVDTGKDTIVFIDSLEDVLEKKLLFATKEGMIKQVDGQEFEGNRKTMVGTKLNDGDSLVSVVALEEEDQVAIQTKEGYFLRFSLEEVPLNKKNAIGVRGIKLKKKDKVENIYAFAEGTECKVVYKEKEVTLNKLKAAKRDGGGTKTRL